MCLFMLPNIVRKDWVLLPFAVLLINWSHQCRIQMSATPSQSQTLQEKKLLFSDTENTILLLHLCFSLCKNKIRKDEKYPLVSWKLKTFFANLRDEKNSFINLIKRQSMFLTAEAVLDTYCTFGN